jgi:hypothetical protein
MATNEDALTTAIRNLVRAGRSAIASAPDPIVHYEGLEEWFVDPSDETIFRRRAQAYPMLRMEARAVIEALPEWSAAMDALHADSDLGPLVDRLVGTPLGSGIVQSDGLLRSAVERSAGSADLDQLLADLVGGWRFSIAADPVPSTILVILIGLQPIDEVRLSDDISVRVMTDAEVAAALRVSIMPVMPISAPMVFVRNRVCIAIRDDLRRVVGDDNLDTAEAMAIYSRRDSLAETALATLRLLGFRHVREYARITIDGRGGMQYGVRGSGYLGPSQEIDRAVEPRARALFRDVDKALRDASKTAIAIRRFSGSHEPRNDEDRLLDLWIAIEALFSPDDATEVTYRVALNVANTIELQGLDRRRIFDWVKRGYGLRSDLVHGRGPSFRKMPRIHGGVTTTVGEAADDLSEVVGVALQRFLEGAVPADFTQLALRGTRTPDVSPS